MKRIVPRELRVLAGTPSGKVLVGVVGAIALVTVLGLALLWPGKPELGANTAGVTLGATVTAASVQPCGPVDQDCRRVTVRAGDTTADLQLGPVALTPEIGVGDRVRVSRVRDAQPGQPSLSFVDIDRRTPLALWAGVLALVAVVALLWRGLLALVGVVLSIGLVVAFLVPAILEGQSALLVGLVASLAVTFITTVLTNGFGAQTFAAVLGVTVTLLLATLLAWLATQLAFLDGRTDETALTLSQSGVELNLQGIVIASMLIGALGVLADTAVTQASAVMALRRANPSLTARGLYAEAFVVGRDHLSATIHTLVLAYVGAALPLLLALRAIELPLVDTLNGQAVAQPLLAAIVGCLALIAAVPITTGLASLLVVRVPVAAVPSGHGHAH